MNYFLTNVKTDLDKLTIKDCKRFEYRIAHCKEMELRRYNIFNSRVSCTYILSGRKITISLTVTNAAGSNTTTKSGYIVAKTLKPPLLLSLRSMSLENHR